jgi:tetratricopeptide (TPR) repeat protein
MISDNYAKGTYALQKGKNEKAIQFFKRETYPCKELYLNMGTAYFNLNDYKRAKENFLKAADLEMPFVNQKGAGEYPNALGNLGLLAYSEGDDELSKYYCTRALAVEPLHYMSIWNYSLALLREYCSGKELHKWAWKMYEYRFKTVAKTPDIAPRWYGGTKVGKLVVVTEQGYGDKIMFGRYLDRLKDWCSELVIQCTDDMKGMYSQWNTCNELPLDADASVPICNLAWIFGDEANAEWLRGKYVGAKGDKFRVALEWSGNPNHKNDLNRSCPPGYLAKLIKRFPEIEFVNIRPGGKKIKGVRPIEPGSWDETAVALAGCDLLISVDTSITDFRWGNWRLKKETGMDVESNIWYPSVKVIENPGWEKLIDEVIVRLEIAKSEWFIKQMLGGHTVEEFVEKYADHVNTNNGISNPVSINA